MKLSINSWSQRFQDFVFMYENDRSANLCHHFWMTVLAVSLVTIFLPFYLIIRAGWWLISTIDTYHFNKSHNEFLAGKELTVEQVFALMSKKGWAGYDKNGQPWFSTNEICSMWLKGKSKRMLDGWRNANYNDWARQLKDYVDGLDDIEVKKEANFKLSLIQLRRVVFSYLPVIYVTLAYGIAAYVGLMYFAYGTAAHGDVISAQGIALSLIVFVFISLALASFYKMPGNNRYSFIGRWIHKYAEPLEDDVLVSYLKAVKQKACPLIEWTD